MAVFLNAGSLNASGVTAVESGNRTTRTTSLEVLVSLTIALNSYLLTEIKVFHAS